MLLFGFFDLILCHGEKVVGFTITDVDLNRHLYLDLFDDVLNNLFGNGGSVGLNINLRHFILYETKMSPIILYSDVIEMFRVNDSETKIHILFNLLLLMH